MPTDVVAKGAFPEPEEIFIDEGNSTRRPTSREMWEHFGWLHCESEDCVEEEKQLDAPVRRPEEIRVVPKPIDVVHATSTVDSAGALSWSTRPGTSEPSPAGSGLELPKETPSA